MRIAIVLFLLVFFQFDTTAGQIANTQVKQQLKTAAEELAKHKLKIAATYISQATKPSTKVFTSRGDRFKITRVSIEGGNDHYRTRPGELVTITMAVRHDCRFCGNAINQVIVGLSSDIRAQVTVWNGKQRSGGKIYVINRGSNVETYGQANSGSAQWVDVTYQLRAPARPGSYDIRARYAQAYQGNILTDEGRKLPQKVAIEPLKWWKVDRPNGPDSKANIGTLVVQ